MHVFIPAFYNLFPHPTSGPPWREVFSPEMSLSARVPACRRVYRGL